MWEIERQLKHANYPGHYFPICFLHDEILSEVWEPEAAFWATAQAQIMREAMVTVCPDVKIKAEPVLMCRWQKNAEPAYRNGILIPWEDRDGVEK